MKIRLGGLVPWSSVDYPGHQAAVLFCSGCPWQCSYCHNRHLWDFKDDLGWLTVRALLAKRHGLLDAVVFSGGEPLMQVVAVQSALIEIRQEGYGTALHTAGVAPRRLESLLPLVDWVGLDVKGPFSQYATVTHRKNSGDAARVAVALLLASGKPYQLRTTVHPSILSSRDLIVMVTDLANLGATTLTLQNFRPSGCADGRLNTTYRHWLTDDLRGHLQSIMPAISLPPV